jgi:uncharacterized protein YrrD
MLQNIQELSKYTVGATDGALGHAEDFYFDDERWVVRYLVVDTGSWLSGREVLISPIALGTPDRAERVLPVALRREQIEKSPVIDTHKPVSRQHETRYLGYYGYPYYWGGLGLWGGGLYPGTLMPGPAGVVATHHPDALDAEQAGADIHLRSCKEVKGYHIHASDGELGHVQGFLVDEETWAIRFLIVNTSNWWLGHEVLISPQWIHEVSWEERSVYVSLSRAQIQSSPAYDHSTTLEREHEIGLYDHYQRPGYWKDELGQRTNARR